MKILIIKCGASGDVVRTTAILSKLEGAIFWITKYPNNVLLPNNVKAFDIADIDKINNINFDLVLSLDDDVEILQKIQNLKHKVWVGAFLQDNSVDYTDNSKNWFDMSLVSKYGISVADKLKKQNTRCYQDYLFEFLGEKFNGEKYIINTSANLKKKENLIGIEKRCGARWPTKQWNKYHELAEILTKDGYTVRFFEQKDFLLDYLRDISECTYIFCGDTLAMHLALGCNCKVFALFTCTPPAEIYDYGMLHKIYHKDVDKHFYTTEYVEEAINLITLEKVYKEFNENK